MDFQAHAAVNESDRLQGENCTLLGEQNQLKLKIEDLEAMRDKIRAEVSWSVAYGCSALHFLDRCRQCSALKAELEVAQNDRSALEEEFRRLSDQRSGLELDLASALFEKDKLQNELDDVDEERAHAVAKLQENAEKETTLKAKLAEAKEDAENKQEAINQLETAGKEERKK